MAGAITFNDRDGFVQLELGPDPEEQRRTALETERDATISAIERAEANAPDEWVTQADAALIDLARHAPTFIVDALWDSGLQKPPEARAIGNVMRRAARNRLIEATDQFLPSAQPGRHQCPARVWRSLVYEGPS